MFPKTTNLLACFNTIDESEGILYDYVFGGRTVTVSLMESEHVLNKEIIVES